MCAPSGQRFTHKTNHWNSKPVPIYILCYPKAKDWALRRIRGLSFRNLVPRGFSAFNMAAARRGRRPWHTADHVTKISNEDGDLFKMTATAKGVRRSEYELWLRRR